MDYSCSYNMNIASLSESQADRNVYEFDLSLWTLLKHLAEIHPREVSEQFSLPLETVESLADATKHQLELLSSGVILSFKLSSPEKTYISHLEQSFDQICLTPSSDSGFGAAYWLLMGKVSQQDINIAAQTFGVSVNLTKIVSQASDNQLRNLACSQDMPFSIRFSPELVREILDSDEQRVTHLILKKHQQSITTTGGGNEL
ncbi:MULTISPECIES: hypothetical protein [Vibrio]|uniref:Uncharacterized protein n=2 Tax=Vibrionaceae TaxID=641 RepID=A0A2T5EK05_VIBSP|nr:MULTISPECIES: hypothetical protein [Vibrio]NOI05870.1 hypothetical protein [Vibrio anguillarum]PTP20505.1 hypothetical protein CWO36_08250 [Vibrio splendidus]